MVNCSDFLRDYSSYRDGLLGAERRAAFEAHVSECPSCDRYDRVVGDGVGQLQALRTVEPSHDFMPRLQHRLYHLEEERTWWSRRDASGASAGFVLLLAIAIGVTAWLPVTPKPKELVVELPPVAAAPPQRTEPVHALFRSGPYLTPRSMTRLTPAPNSASLLHYSPLVSYRNTTHFSASTGPR
jgi:anti-sigma factor RsiW